MPAKSKTKTQIRIRYINRQIEVELIQKSSDHDVSMRFTRKVDVSTLIDETIKSIIDRMPLVLAESVDKKLLGIED